MSNVAAYKECEVELASKLEAHYQLLMFNKRYEEAVDVLGRLMAFKLIDRWDERLDKKYKPFKQAGISTEDRFKYDLRKDSNYSPEWLFADIPHYFGTTLRALGHMGKRVEGEYSCDMVYPEKELEIAFRLLNTPRSAKDAIESIGKTYLEETGKKLNVAALAEEAEVGFARVYEISISNNVVNGYKIMGYVVLVKSIIDGNFHGKLMMKYKVFKHLFVDIVTAQRLFAATIKDSLNMGENLKLGSIMDTRKAAAEQTKIIKEDRDKLHKYKMDKKAAEA